MTPGTGSDRFVADTHALIWHLAEDRRLSTEARRLFLMADRSEAVVYLSVISLIESLYLHERGKIPHNLWLLLLRTITREPEASYQLLDVGYDLVLSLAEVPRDIVPEMPDRIIAATAYHLGIPLITRDDRLHRWEGVVTIW